MAISGRTSTTKAMGQGSTQHQHLVQTEVPPKLLEDWIDLWRAPHGVAEKLKVSLKPRSAGSDLLELSLLGPDGKARANVVFATIQDRKGRNILSIRDQNNFALELRKKRLMTLMQLFLMHRYKIYSVHYVSPTDDNQRQAEAMKKQGLFRLVNVEVGEIIVADVDQEKVKGLLALEKAALVKQVLAR
jgi:isocitrate lyase